ncbi:Diacylglycerol O-acyltransferase [Bertholletia excelsa]
MESSAPGVSFASFSPLCRSITRTGSATFKHKLRQITFAAAASVSNQRKSTPSGSTNRRFDEEKEAFPMPASYDDLVAQSQVERPTLKDYLEQSKDMLRSIDGGPPRWFSPLECGSRSTHCPLLLFLPGIDGVGLGLMLHHQRIREMFDVWCLHIPVTDRTPFTELVKLVARTVRSENNRSPERPIYIVGESLGGCLALAVAANNSDIDLVLILVNPATCFNKSQLQPLIPFLEVMPGQLHFGVPYLLSSLTGAPLRMVMPTVEKGLPLQQTVGEISQDFMALSSYLSVLADVLPGETLLWKLQITRSAAAYANSRLHAVKAQTLILSSGKDQLLPSQEEGERLRCMLPNCKIRNFSDSGHALLLEDGFDLVTVIKGASVYRRARFTDYASDYLLPSPTEFKKIYESWRWLEVAADPVVLSTLENGKIVKGFAGIPSEGPVLFVGYHMLLGLEVVHLICHLWIERNILVRGIAHPMLFTRLRDEKLHDVSAYDGMKEWKLPFLSAFDGLAVWKLPDVSEFDYMRIMGAVPVSASNLYKLLSSKCHVLLYPGGVREALHRKGEEYQLFWPEQSEFVRMAARFGAKIIPFGTVGEDDIGQVLFDYDDLMKIPFYKAGIENMKQEVITLRTEIDGEVAKQDPHLPIILPKVPGRFYYLFGKPIQTEGRKQELRNREEAHKLYLEVKSQVEDCMAYLRERRENDPYRNILPRLMYRAMHGFNCKVPTFEL